MKGLIDQAKCQLWNAVSDLKKPRNQVSQSNCKLPSINSVSPRMRAGLKRMAYLKKVVGFTDNLDHLSSKLFALHVGNGGREYYGRSSKQRRIISLGVLVRSVYKVVFVAGNETFNQGHVSFSDISEHIKRKSITVNTIYCGPGKSR